MGRIGIGLGRMGAEHRRRPSGVVGVTCNMVDMELGHEIAEGGDIHLVGLEVHRHQMGDVARFMDELDLILMLEFINFAQAGALGHEDQPRVIGIVHQQDAAEG